MNDELKYLIIGVVIGLIFNALITIFCKWWEKIAKRRKGALL